MEGFGMKLSLVTVLARITAAPTRYGDMASKSKPERAKLRKIIDTLLGGGKQGPTPNSLPQEGEVTFRFADPVSPPPSRHRERLGVSAFRPSRSSE